MVNVGRKMVRWESAVYLWVGVIAVCGLCIGVGAVGIVTADGESNFFVGRCHTDTVR